MSTTPEEVRTRPVLAAAPELWAGPSFLWSTPCEDGWALLAGGWRLRGTEWEGRFADAGLVQGAETETPWGWPAHLFTSPGSGPGSGSQELEVILDDSYLDLPGLPEALDAVLGADAAAELIALPRPGGISITRNRPLLAGSTSGLRVADLRFSALPYSHGDIDRPVQYASRWLRLAASAEAVVLLWAPPEGHWQADHVRWPHHAVPSRRVDSLRVAARPAPPAIRLACILGDCLEHEAYYLDTWQLELEAWEANVYSSLAEGEAVLRGVDLSDRVRARAGTLATFLSRTEFDLRALRRRLDVEPLFDSEEIRRTVAPGLDRSTRTQTENQRLRREAFSLLTSVAAGEQLQATRDQADAADAQRHATEALQQTIAWVTALLLAPTIVIGIFGANIVQFAPDSAGTLPELAQWAVLASGLSMAVLWWRMPPPFVRPGLRAFPLVLAVLLVITGLSLAVAGHPRQGALWSVTVATWLVAALVALRRPDRRRRRTQRRT